MNELERWALREILGGDKPQQDTDRLASALAAKAAVMKAETREKLRDFYLHEGWSAKDVGWVLQTSHEDALAYLGVERREDDTDMATYWP